MQSKQAKKNQLKAKSNYFKCFTGKMLFALKTYKEHRHMLKKALNVKIAYNLETLNKTRRNIYLKRNLNTRSYLYRITRRAMRKKSILKRTSGLKPWFTKKIKIEKRFLYRARNSLILTKKFLYKKQFPKIKGKKNRNFNFLYYNNIEKTSLKFYIGRIVITYLHNNTYINIHDSKKMLKVFSAGLLGFKGPKRSTPYSRQVVARKTVKYLLKTKINILDIYLNSNYNRWYYFMFKEFSKPKVKPYAIRYLVSNNPRSHGFLRDKKHRRK